MPGWSPATATRQVACAEKGGFIFPFRCSFKEDTEKRRDRRGENPCEIDIWCRNSLTSSDSCGVIAFLLACARAGHVGGGLWRGSGEPTAPRPSSTFHRFAGEDFLSHCHVSRLPCVRPVTAPEVTMVALFRCLPSDHHSGCIEPASGKAQRLPRMPCRPVGCTMRQVGAVRLRSERCLLKIIIPWR